MSRWKWLLLITILVLSVWLVILRTLNTNTPTPSTTPSTIGPDDEGLPPEDEYESGIFDDAEPLSEEERLKLNPWSVDLPVFTNHYSIYYSGKNEDPTVEIMLESKNSAEYQAYLKEALAWLRSQGTPVDSLDISTRYRGQK